jgi:hypothetical protein
VVQRWITLGEGPSVDSWEAADVNIRVQQAPNTMTERCANIFTMASTFTSDVLYARMHLFPFRLLACKLRASTCLSTTEVPRSQLFHSKSLQMQPEKFDVMKKHGSDFCSTALVRIRPGEFFARVMAQQVRSSYLLLKHSVL